MIERNTKPKEEDLASATMSQVTRWDERLAEIDTAEVNLRAERATLLGKKEAALALIDRLSQGPTQIPLAVDDETQSPANPRRKQKTQQVSTITAHTTWVDAVTFIAHSAPLGLSHAELREAIENSALAKKFRTSQKGYYHALTRLAERETIVRHNGRVFSPDAYKAYERKVLAGELKDEPPPKSNAYSPMGEAILDIVTANPGITGKDIIHELRTDPEFNASLSPHTTGAFNIMARLVRRKQIARWADGSCHPGPNMPKRAPNSKWLQRSLLMQPPSPKRGAS